MPPRSKKAAAPAADGDDAAPRRSSRIKDQPKPDPPKKKAPAKPRAKKAKEGAPAEDAEESKKRAAEDAPDEPPAKKAKPASKAGSAKPASKAGSVKPASKAEPAAKDGEAGVPETIAEEEGEDAAPAVKALDIGDVLPDITLLNEKGEELKVTGLTAERGVVLFLFPKADTPGCTKQACAFRDNYAAFTELGYDVYGLSGDTGAAQTKWQTKNNLPYSFLSDPKKELIKALGAWQKSTKRSHFVVEKGGKIIDKKLPVKPEESYSLALEAIKAAKS